MANIYLLEMVEGKIKAVFHFDIPAGNNVAGISFATAYVRMRTGVAGGTIPTVLPDGVGDDTGGTIGTAEKAAVGNGTRVEVVDIVEVPGGWAALSGANKKAYFAAKYTQVSTAKAAALTEQLNYYGLTSP